MKRLFAFFNIPVDDANNAQNTVEHMKEFFETFKEYQITVITSSLWELYPSGLLQQHVQYIHRYCTQENYLHFHFCNLAQLQDTKFHHPYVIPYAFFKHKILHSVDHQDQKFSTKWNRDKFRGLFLSGKSDKLNRIMPLIQFKELEILNTNDMEWSLHYVNSQVDAITDVVHKANRDAQEPIRSKKFVAKFLKRHARNPDQISHVKAGGAFHHDGVPFDHTLYENTSFSFISESNSCPETGSNWITEKTWRAILNHHPFIMFAEPRMLECLSKQGYRTFEKYFPEKYDHIYNTLQRYDTIYRNITWLKDNWNTLPFDQINQDIVHNYELLVSSYNEEQKQLRSQINYTANDEKLNLLLFMSEAYEQPKKIGVDHLVYYNWGSLPENKFIETERT